MKSLYLTTCTLFIIIGCNAQEEQPQSYKNGIAEPREEWSVNTEYDDFGNLKRYDSTYTWSYNGNAHDFQVRIDSLMAGFRRDFNRNFPSFFDRNFPDTIWRDTLFFRNFGRPDFFQDLWQNDFFDMDKMMKEMDSLRERLLEKSFPGKIHPGREENEEVEI